MENLGLARHSWRRRPLQKPIFHSYMQAEANSLINMSDRVRRMSVICLNKQGIQSKLREAVLFLSMKSMQLVIKERVQEMI
jgi:hypothetical protein